MSSINGSNPTIPTYPSTGTITNDKLNLNKMKAKKPWEDEYVRDGKGGWKQVSHENRAHTNRQRIEQDAGHPINESINNRDDGGTKAARGQAPIDFEIKSDGKGEWVKVDGDQEPIDFEIKSDGKGEWVKVDGDQEPVASGAQTSKIDNDKPRSNALEKTSIEGDVEVSDGQGGWRDAVSDR